MFDPRRSAVWIAAGALVLATPQIGWAASNSLPDPAPRGANWLVPSLHGLGLMTAMRVGEAIIWPDPFYQLDPPTLGQRYRRAWTEPPKWDSSQAAFEWDGDPWWINTLGHGLFGSELHLRARECGATVAEALLFTTVGGYAWDYVFEASGVRPSGLDLWFTPLSGLVLGELRYWVWRAARSISNPTWRGIVRTVSDPLGELERGFGTPC